VSVNEIDYLTVDDLLEIAAGVLDNVALSDAGALAAAVGRPPVTILGVDAYPTFDDTAATLLYLLVRNHSLVDVTSVWPGRRPASPASLTGGT